MSRNQLFLTILGAVLGVVLATAATLIVVLPAETPDEPPPPRGPTGVPKNGTVMAVAGPRIVKLAGSRRSYVLREGVAHSIPDGGTFICSAEYYPIEFNVAASAWDKRVTRQGDDARCPVGPPPELRPTTVVDSYLLIERDERSETDQRTAVWQVVSGQLVPAPKSGPTFDCLSKRYLAWDYVSPEEIRRFRRHPSVRRARCP